MPEWVGDKLFFYADSGPRRLMDLFSVKWSSMVLHALWHWPQGAARTGELQRSLQGISKKMLFQTLKELEMRGLIHREVFSVVPPKVEYSLTALGKVVAEPVEQMYLWGLANQQALDEMSENLLRNTQHQVGQESQEAK